MNTTLINPSPINPTILPPLTHMRPAIERLSNVVRALAVLSFVLWTVGSTAQPIRASEKPLLAQSGASLSDDEIWLINTRAIGTACNGNAMSQRLQCERYVASPHHRPQWISGDWHDIVSESTDERPTIVYIHGNRIARGEDRARGMRVYRSLARNGRPDSPVRFIIWSWPSSPISGPVKDYQVKANRTRPAAWQLAWFLDQLPAHSRVSLLGYSYGARVASGAMHILGGGSLGGLKLDQRIHPQIHPIRIAMLAAAFDANWIQPGHFHGRAMSQVERLVVVTNRLDPVLRFYHLSNGRGHVDALGKKGMPQPQTLGSARQRVKRIDFTHTVGRSHSLADYLAASGKMRSVWKQLLPSDASAQDAILSAHQIDGPPRGPKAGLPPG